MRPLLALAPLAFVLTLSTVTLAAPPPARVAQAGPNAKTRGKAAKAPKKKPEPAPPQEEPVTKAEAAPAPAAAAAPAATPATPRPGDADVAQTPPKDPDATPISVAPILGYATTHANLGLGVRGGYTLPQHVYIGGTLVYHFGTSVDVPAPEGNFSSSVHFLYTGAEAGYAIKAGPVVVRPYGGVGALFALSSTSGGPGGDASDTKTSLALWPGCTVSWDIPSSRVFVGGDVRVLISTAGGDPSLGMFATAGMHF